MHITDNVIRDLMPLYMAGEASPDTIRLVEEYLAHNPALRSLAMEEPPIAPVDSPPPLEKRSLEHTRSLLARKNRWLAAAVLFTLAPFAFRFGEQGIATVLYRDMPWLAAAALLIGLAAWAGFLLTLRRLSFTGFPAPRSWPARLGWAFTGYLIGCVLYLVASHLGATAWPFWRYLNSTLPMLCAFFAVYLGERLHRFATIEEFHRPTTLFTE